MEEPSPAVQHFLRVSPCRQRLHEYTLRNLFLAIVAAAPCSPVQCLVRISPLEMLSTVTPSSPIWTPTLRKNVQRTSSLASWLSKALTHSIWISGTPPPPSEHASSLAVIQVHPWVTHDGLPRQLPPLPHTLGLQSQKSHALHVDGRILGHVPKQSLSVPSSKSASTVAATICTNKLTERITYLSHPVVTVWQPINAHSHVGIQHINWIFTAQIHAKSAGLLRVPRQSILW